MKKTYITLAHTCLILMLNFNFQELRAESYTWVGNNNSWNIPENWQPIGVPITGDNVTITGGTVMLDMNRTITDLTITGGNLDGNFNFTVNGTFSWSGGTISGIGIMNVAGTTTITNAPTLSARTLNLNGGGNWSPTGFTTNSNANMVIPIGQTLTVTTTGNTEFYGSGGTITVGGDLVKNGPGYLALHYQSLNTTGTVTVNQGQLYCGAFGYSGTHTGATFNIAAGAAFYPQGSTHTFTSCTINGPGTFASNSSGVGFATISLTNCSLKGNVDFGTADLGVISSFSGNTLSPGLSPGSLTVSNYAIPFANNTYNVELAGYGGPGDPTGHDQIVVSGAAATLGGTLNISFLNSFTPTIGDEFIIMTCTGGCSGSFSNIVHPGNNPNAWTVTTNNNQVKLMLAQALPLELIDFQAFVQNEITSITWRTANEVNVSHFEIERSATGKDWQSIGEIQARNLLEESAYHFVDEHPLPDQNYYRLRQEDLDGTFEYSPIEVVTMNGVRTAVSEFYPNPSAAATVSLNLAAKADGELRIQFSDLNGRVHWIETRLVTKGNNLLNFDVARLASGVYFVKMGNGREEVYRKLVIE